VSFEKTKSIVYSLTVPFLKYDTSKFNPGRTKVTVSAWDSTMTQSTKITAEFDIIIVEDPYDELNIAYDQPKQTPVYTTQGGLVKHYFPSSFVTRGNAVKLGIGFSQESKTCMDSEIIETIDYKVVFDKT
jgi:hypothetical protein